MNQYLRRTILDIEKLPSGIRSGSLVKAIGCSGKIFEGTVIDESATLKINCGEFTGIFDDRIIIDMKITRKKRQLYY